MRKHTAQNGYVALLSVLVLSAIATTVAVTLLLTGTDASRETLIVQQSAAARSYVDACAEEALQQIHDDTTFLGQNNLSLSQGTCSFSIVSTGTSTRTVSVSATVGSTVRRASIYVTISSSNISVNSWQEDSS